KENELSHAFDRATNTLSEQRQSVGLVAGIVLVVALLGGGYWAWHTRTETRAQAALGDALLLVQSPVDPPKPDASGKITQAPGTYPTVNARAEAALVKFTQVADQYPSSSAGIAARYYSAAALGML